MSWSLTPAENEAPINRKMGTQRWLTLTLAERSCGWAGTRAAGGCAHRQMLIHLFAYGAALGKASRCCKFGQKNRTKQMHVTSSSSEAPALQREGDQGGHGDIGGVQGWAQQ